MQRTTIEAVPLVRYARHASLCALVLVSCTLPSSDTRAEARGSLARTRPNIVLVLLDDLEREGMAYMPRTLRLVGDSGMTLQNAFVSAPLCCPSRVSLLRGQYPHNTGVWANGGTDGGFAAAYRKGVERSTVATWLRDAGYRTALFGKYLNMYPSGASKQYVPPGWTDWAVPVDGTPYREFDYELNHNGRLEAFGHESAEYGTDVYVTLAETFIRSAVSADDPFFLLLAPFAPHAPSTPAPRHAHLFEDVRLPDSPSRSEGDISDKHPMMRNLPVLAPGHVEKVHEGFRNRLRSLQAVDEGVERLLRVLREVGQLQSTLFIVTSDNGFHILEHRLPPGKETAYEPDIRVPFVVRGPGVPAGSRSDAIVLNNDLAPTIAELAGASIPSFVDGRSVLSVLRGEASGSKRQAFLSERRLPDHLQRYDSSAIIARRLRAKGRVVGVPEFEDYTVPDAGDGAARAEESVPEYTLEARTALIMVTRFPHFNALRTSDGWSYIEHDGGFVELYDLNRDPHQLENLSVTRPTPETRERIASLARWTQAILRCSGETCREAEDTRTP